MKITRDNLINHIFSKSKDEISKEDIKIACEEMFDSIGKALTNNNRIELRGFGSFSIRERLVPLDPRQNNQGNNQRSKCNSIYFKMSKNLHDKLNSK